ncbi:Piso0_003044 [Millerozyma farinosa CBS 7064]|uniref:Piso0_003044 protein n=1 Tax=Pichia sorbitophila (strain ATCC MYA-4447 / BCRC 22081 / CBS 7064 / NBRC 10061 / NRRL Y-12695) TaxID=559304 RepID=G8YK71_PICSO|nr:Piso0_003044 [Millerozyma farinosa CBS 7064]CCE80716.1 Piso0_003044 [Millerozyma farinosa CBS 7064]
MALAETVLRKVHKLGLVPKLIKLIPLISFLFALASVSWLLVLPMDGFYRDTYISENALMPAQATSYFRESEWNHVRGFRTALQGIEDKAIPERNQIVEGWLQQYGLKTAYHKNNRGDDTLYAIMHAPRGEDTEAIVLTAPWSTSEGSYNVGGIATAVALLRYFKKMSIWSKNIILVLPEDGHVALRSWVEAYHTSLDETAGSIEAALVIEYGSASDHFDFYEVVYEGLNGQLPNLDLMNTINLIGYHENIGYSIQGTTRDELQKRTYSTRLRTLLKGILNLALVGLKKKTPGNEAFSGWQIQAVTVRAKGVDGPSDVTQFGRIIDSTFRSVNNLLEKFHQSFFFYLMLSPDNFVSIGTYLPAAVLLAVAYVLSSLGCLVINEVQAKFIAQSAYKILTIFIFVELGCLMLAKTLPLFVLGSDDDESVAALILYGFTVLTFASFVLSIKNQWIPKKYRMDKSLTFCLIALALFLISLLLTALLIVNFALAFLIGLAALPLTFIQPLVTTSNLKLLSESPKEKRKDLLSYLVNDGNSKRLKIGLCLLVSSPFFIIYIIGNLFVDESKGALILMKGLLTSWDELQCWTWFIVILGWFSAWSTVALSCIFGDFEIDSVESKMKKE